MSSFDMRSFRTVASAETKLRKLCGETSTINITMHRHSRQTQAVHHVNEQWRIKAETEDGIIVDSLNCNSLDMCMECIRREIVAQRVKRAKGRSTNANILAKLRGLI